MLICLYNHVSLHGIFAYENINVMMFKYIFGHYANKLTIILLIHIHYICSCSPSYLLLFCCDFATLLRPKFYICQSREEFSLEKWHAICVSEDVMGNIV